MDSLLLLFRAPVLALQLLIDGVLTGAIFALAAYGMALVWGVMKIINICQGSFVMLGGFVALELVDAGMPAWLGVPVAATALFAVGWAINRLVISRIIEQDLFISILATFGLAILLDQLMNEVFGADVRTLDSGLGTWFLFDGLVSISQVKVAAFIITLLIAVALVLFMRGTRLGQAIRATAQNARAARILGIDTDRTFAMTYAINAALCGATGALVAMVWTVSAYAGIIYTIRAFMIVVTAGIGNLPGVIAAGLGLGTFEQFVGFILGAQFQIALVFLLLVAILVYRSRRLALQRKRLQ